MITYPHPVVRMPIVCSQCTIATHLTLLLFIVFIEAAYTEDSGTSHKDIKHTSDIQQYRLLVDSSGTGTIEEVFASLSANPQSTVSLPVNFGYVSSPVWVLVSTKTFTEDVVVRIKPTLLDTVEVFIGDSSGFSHYVSCGFLSNKNKPALQDIYSSFVLKKRLPAEYVLIKVRTSDVCAIGIDILSYSAFIKTVKLTNLLYGIYFGAIIIIAIINILLFFSAKFTTSLWYALYILSFAVSRAFSSGIIELAYVFNFVELMKNATPLFACLTLLFGSIFTSSFLLIDTTAYRMPVTSAVFKVFKGVGIILSIIALLGMGTYASIGISIVAPIFLAACIVAGIRRIELLGRPAVFFTIAISTLTIGITANCLRNFGVIPNSFLGVYGIFISSVLEFIIIAIALVYRIADIEMEKNEAHIEAQHAKHKATENHLKALQAQINPHFLFNTLNTLAELVSISPERAENMVLALSRFFRFTLTASRSRMVNLEDELEIVRSYLTIQKNRYEERLNYEIEIVGNTQGIQIVGLIIQPIVENSIKYGISPTVGGGMVTIRVVIDQKVVKISIHDTGPGFGNSKREHGTSHGLSNIRQRLKFAYGERAELKCENNDGALVELILPVEGGNGIQDSVESHPNLD